jgi:hypothetical protein
LFTFNRRLWWPRTSAKDPQVMKDIKAGDKVEATFTEAVLVEVVPAKK